MKTLLFLICIIIVTSCSSRYEFEDKMYKCAKDAYQSKNINLDQFLDDYDSYLIEKKYIKNTSPQSYVELIDSLIQPSTFQISLPEKFQSKIGRVILLNEDCLGYLPDSSELKQLRVFQIAKEAKIVFEQISKVGELDPFKINKDLLKILRKDDFKHPLYKLFFFHLLDMYASFIQEDKGVLATLPPWSEDESGINKLKERNVFSVLVNSKSEILIRNQPMKLKDLKMSAKEFIANPNNKPDLAESPTKAIISLKNDRETKYEVYIKVLHELKAAYNELRNEKAMELYDLSYEKLEKTQQKEIRRMIPLVISEAEPTAFGEEE